MHKGGQPAERGVFLEVEAAQQYLKGDAFIDVRELRAVEIEPDCGLWTVRGSRQPQKSRFLIDEALDEPRAGNAIDPKMRSSSPRFLLKVRRIISRDRVVHGNGFVR